MGRANRCLRYRVRQALTVRRRNFGGDGQVANSERLIRESSSSLTPCPLLGKRPETFYSTIAVPVVFWMLFARILVLASLQERMLVALDCFQGNRVTPCSHL
jgi:hypothetical protein